MHVRGYSGQTFFSSFAVASGILGMVESLASIKGSCAPEAMQPVECEPRSGHAYIYKYWQAAL